MYFMQIIFCKNLCKSHMQKETYFEHNIKLADHIKIKINSVKTSRLQNITLTGELLPGRPLSSAVVIAV